MMESVSSILPAAINIHTGLLRCDGQVHVVPAQNKIMGPVLLMNKVFPII